MLIGIVIFMVLFFVGILSLEVVPKDMTVWGFIKEKFSSSDDIESPAGNEYIKDSDE